MNARERKALDRIDGIVRTIGTLSPPNPANTAAIFHNLPLATRAAKHVTAAIGHLRFQDWGFMDEELSAAEKLLVLDPAVDAALSDREVANGG